VSLVLTARRGPVAHVTLSRPDKRNALSLELAADLRAALAQLAAAKEPPRALVLAGSGAAFCAGGDLDLMRSRVGNAQATVAALRSYLSTTVLALARFPAPTIARVHGAAIGAGLGLALACDHVLVAKDAKLAAGQTSIGLAPDGGLSWSLVKRMGLTQALALAQNGRVVSGGEAVTLGLVTSSYADERALDAAVDALGSELAARPTRALVAARELILAGSASTLEEALDREAVAQGLAYTTADVAEGVDAAVAKRTPRFAGR
jgi:2-(1,2-epoxy-1,2-dihydrophenyl)acetyl-CoA isomerase